MLEKILPFDPAVPFPRCIKGTRACPPEDCVGPWAYQQMLKILKDPEHPEYEDQIGWLGDEEFDPERFEIDEVNATLKEVFSRRVRTAHHFVRSAPYRAAILRTMRPIDTKCSPKYSAISR